jgi:phosphoribosylformylglycinamidine cyclo-ligase
MNPESHSQSYRASGVDITRGYRAVDLMRPFVESTRTPGVADAIGGFGGLFRPDLAGMSEPVLVSGTDGVGTKLKLAFLLDRHDTVGRDCVAMCVNDIVCCGAKPLFFLDYIACGRLNPEKVASIVSGVAAGCVECSAALVGGETAEMPGFYPPDEYDLAGFAVGIADRPRLLDKTEMRPGDVLLALPSSGLHSNGFSLVRKVFRIGEGGENRRYAELPEPLWETLLTPTRIYAKQVASLLATVRPRSLAHITGGGFFENIPRALADGCRARIERKAVRTPPVFGILQREGDIPERDMFNTFNMGVGMVAAVAADDADRALEVLRGAGEEAYVLGEIIAGEKGVDLC